MTDKEFPYPYTLDNLPGHVARVISDSERKNLPDFEIRKDHPGKGFITLGTQDEGTYSLYPEQMNGDDPMVQIKYRPHRGLDQENIKAMSDDTLSSQEKDRRFRLFSGSELGSIWSQEKAVELLDFVRRNHFDLSGEQQLVKAGFEEQETKGVWRKAHGKDSYCVILKPGTVWLMFEPHNKTHWHNLMILNSYEAWYSGKGISPLDWPDTINDVERGLVGMAVHMTEIWSPELLPGKKKKRAPKA